VNKKEKFFTVILAVIKEKTTSYEMGFSKLTLPAPAREFERQKAVLSGQLTNYHIYAHLDHPKRQNQHLTTPGKEIKLIFFETFGTPNTF
jgi:hypothetical protein